MRQRTAFLPVVAGLVVAITLAGCSRAGGASATGARDARPASKSAALYREVTAEVGLAFRHHVTVGGSYALPEIMGSGVAVFDADGDGRLDLYFLDAGEKKGQGAPDRLFLRTPEGKYRDATDGAGLDQNGYGTGVAAGDLDNDGDVDLYVGNYGPDELFLNDGAGRFTDATARAGIAGDRWTSSVGIADWDLDGFLDLWVVTYVKFDPAVQCTRLDGRRDYCPPKAYEGDVDVLYKNRGDAMFQDVTAAAGPAGVARNGLGVITDDFNGDGWPDVYVANDGQANDLWINQKNGKFADEALAWGVAVSGAGLSQASMGVALGDVDQDADLDLFVTNLVNETNTLYLRVDELGFGDGTARSRIAELSRPYTGFGAVFLDADRDGDLDLAVVNGRVERAPLFPGAAIDAHWNEYAERNQLLLNDGGGVFDEGGGGAFAGHAEIGRGLAAADLDGDGDLDLVVTNVSGPARIFDNVATSGHWLSVRTRDEQLKREVVGARIVVRAGGKAHRRVVGPASSYLTSCVTPAHFGLGDATQVDSIEVTWPGGAVEKFAGTPADREITVVRGKGQR
jgi:hypothetical protein